MQMEKQVQTERMAKKIFVSFKPRSCIQRFKNIETGKSNRWIYFLPILFTKMFRSYEAVVLASSLCAGKYRILCLKYRSLRISYNVN